MRHLLVLVIPFVFFGCFKTREDIAREKEEVEVRQNIQQNMVEYNQGVDKLQAEVARLQGRIDELEHQRKKDSAGQASAREKEEKGTAAALEELRGRITAMQEAQNALFEEVKKLHEEGVAAPPPPAAKPSKKKPGGSASASPASFDASLKAYQARDYSAAIAGFRAFLDASPRSKKAVDARYYLGDSLYKQKEFEQAAVEFGSVHEKAPTSFYGRRSALRLAQSFKAMGKNKDAKAFAQLLEQESPDSEEAKTARKMFK